MGQFFGIVIQMFWREHAPLHFHALVVTWPNGADLDAAWMHDELRKAKTWSISI